MNIPKDHIVWTKYYSPDGEELYTITSDPARLTYAIWSKTERGYERLEKSKITATVNR